MNIRIRLAIHFTAIVSCLLLIFSLALYFSFSNYRQQEFYKRILEKVNSTAKILLEEKPINKNVLRLINKNTINAPYSVYIYSQEKKEIYKSDGFKETLDNPLEIINLIDENESVNEEYKKFELSGSKMVYNNQIYYVIGFSYDKYGWDKLRFLGITILIEFLICVILTLIAAFFFSSQALKPISKVMSDVEKIEANNLFVRVDEGNGSDEIAVLAKTFNGMLERLERSFKNQQSFLSNASHELRSPLTFIHNQIELALSKERNNEEYEQILISILEEIKSLGNLSNGLLELATAGFEYSSSRISDLRIDDILWYARAELMKQEESYKVFIAFGVINDDEEGMVLKGNEHLLQIAFFQLLENACKFSDDNQAFVTIISKEKEIEIVILDHGVGIPEKEKNKVFMPFYKASNSLDKKGHGIGLPLAQRIIQLHKGEIFIHSENNNGTKLNILFRSHGNHEDFLIS